MDTKYFAATVLPASRNGFPATPSGGASDEPQICENPREFSQGASKACLVGQDLNLRRKGGEACTSVEGVVVSNESSALDVGDRKEAAKMRMGE
jgi:hypothetical protein